MKAGNDMKDAKQSFEWIDTYDDIISVCKGYGVTCIILFGSRARGTNTQTSDIDIVVYGADNFEELFAELKYNDFTLKMIDIINGDDRMSEDLKQEIERDGKILYEKSR